MRRSRTALLGLVVLGVVCAGCVSPQAPQATTTPESATGTPTATSPAAESKTVTTTERESDPETQTVTTGYTTDCPYALHVDVASEGQRSRTDRVLAYSDLSPARQREFDAARADGSTELGETLPETWAGPRIVSYRGEQYYAVAAVC
jgi:hypothetical protein